MEIIETLEEKGIRKIKIGIFDIDGVFRGKYVSMAKFKSIAKKGFGFCDVVFGWDINDQLYEGTGVTFTGWHTGYPDAHAQVDMATLRTIPWEPNTALFIADFYDPHGDPLGVCPRQLLKRLQNRSQKLGYRPMFASEFEYFLFLESPHSAAEKHYRDLLPLSPGMFGYSALRTTYNSELIHAILDGMHDFNLQIEGFHTETGPGVYETALLFGTALESADRAALFKTAMKEICNRHGVLACFMAKPNAQFPGCSGHLHQSLWDLEGRQNLFFDPQSTHQMSGLFRHYLAGVLELAPEFSAFYMPTINAYKRRVPGTWSPVNVSWGVDNRTASCRVIPGGLSATRLELRITSADINPYIAYAAALAAGLYGIENELELPPVLEGNAYEPSDALELPRSLDRATDLLDQSERARELLGAAFVDHFVATRRWEVREYEKAVTDWELHRYFELI
ncbi:MAG: glutamine synthetase [Myxococcales bacterium]|nr:glutamine synthetase [Myxococcales bacterium]